VRSDDNADRDNIEHRADAQALPEGKPGGQDHQPDKDADGSDRDTDPVGDPLVEYLPGTQPEIGLNHQRKTKPDDDQTEHRLRKPAPQLGARYRNEHGSEGSYQVSEQSSLTYSGTAHFMRRPLFCIISRSRIYFRLGFPATFPRVSEALRRLPVR
jgi:hypothetical protein